MLLSFYHHLISLVFQQVSKLLHDGSSRFLWISEVIYFQKIWEYFAGRNEKFTTKCSYFTVQKTFYIPFMCFYDSSVAHVIFHIIFHCPLSPLTGLFSTQINFFLFNTRFLLGINFFLLTGRDISIFIYPKWYVTDIQILKNFKRNVEHLSGFHLKRFFRLFFLYFFSSWQQFHNAQNRILKLIFLVEYV